MSSNFSVRGKPSVTLDPKTPYFPTCLILKILFQVERVVDGGEPAAFKQYFSVWREGEEGTAVSIGGRKYTAEQVYLFIIIIIYNGAL